MLKDKIIMIESEINKIRIDIKADILTHEIVTDSNTKLCPTKINDKINQIQN
jgi:hypothetical protein